MYKPSWIESQIENLLLANRGIHFPDAKIVDMSNYPTTLSLYRQLVSPQDTFDALHYRKTYDSRTPKEVFDQQPTGKLLIKDHNLSLRKRGGIPLPARLSGEYANFIFDEVVVSIEYSDTYHHQLGSQGSNSEHDTRFQISWMGFKIDAIIPSNMQDWRVNNINLGIGKDKCKAVLENIFGNGDLFRF